MHLRQVVGVVSDYDLLSLEGIAEKATSGTDMFPELSMEWNTFRTVQRLISKNAGKTCVVTFTHSQCFCHMEMPSRCIMALRGSCTLVHWFSQSSVSPVAHWHTLHRCTATDTTFVFSKTVWLM